MAKRNQTIRLTMQKKCPFDLSINGKNRNGRQVSVDHYRAVGRDSGGRGPPLSRALPGGPYNHVAAHDLTVVRAVSVYSVR